MQNDEITSIFGCSIIIIIINGNYYNEYMHYKFMKSPPLAQRQECILSFECCEAIHWVVHGEHTHTDTFASLCD